MGREIKRVPVDFDWPLHKVWDGYLNPHYKYSTKCPWCKNGYNPATQAIDDSLKNEHMLSMDRYSRVKTIAERAGVYGYCEACDGTTRIWMTPKHKEMYESWQEIEPPIGEGWQLWENVSEGSPVSPVFATRDEFIEYLIDEGYSLKAAENFTDIGYAPSFVMSATKIVDGIAACEDFPNT